MTRMPSRGFLAAVVLSLMAGLVEAQTLGRAPMIVLREGRADERWTGAAGGVR